MAIDKWIIKSEDGTYHNIQIPQQTIDNPNSFYNSQEGKKIRAQSNKLYEKLTKN